MAPREMKVASNLGEGKEWVWAQSAQRPGEAPVGGVPWEESVHVHKGHGELGVGWQEKRELKAKVHTGKHLRGGRGWRE